MIILRNVPSDASDGNLSLIAISGETPPRAMALAPSLEELFSRQLTLDNVGLWP
jgi:hypothetical protein